MKKQYSAPCLLHLEFPREDILNTSLNTGVLVENDIPFTMWEG